MRDQNKYSFNFDFEYPWNHVKILWFQGFFINKLKYYYKERRVIKRFAIVIFLCVFASSCSHFHSAKEIGKPKVLRVIDGDTIEILYKGKKDKVRLIGVDTPETKHPNKQVEYYGKEATEFTRKMVEGKEVRLDFDWPRRDRYNRLLAYVYLYDSSKKKEVMLNEEIIKQGYGHAYTRFPFKYLEDFREYGRQASEEGVGLWSGKSYDELFDEAEKSVQKIESGYISSKNSNKFHRPDCKWSKKISSDNLIIFKTRDEVIKNGMGPCKVCGP